MSKINLSHIITVKKNKKIEIYDCSAYYENDLYSFFIYHNTETKDEYSFYYRDGVKPNYTNFETEILCLLRALC